MPDKNVITIADVAQRAGVSRTSVSRYLNGRQQNLSASTTNRIAKAVKELDYRPNAWARSLKTKRSGLIGAVVADLRNEHALAVLEGIESVVNRHGYGLLVSNAQNSQKYEAETIERLIRQRVEGIILQPCDNRPSPAMQSLVSENVPLVLIDRTVDYEPTFDTVLLDNRDAVQKAFNHILQRGYQHVFYVTDPTEHITSRIERENAVWQHQHDTATLRVFIRSTQEPENFTSAIHKFLEQNSSAGQGVIICANVVTTLFVVSVLNQQHVQVPEQVGLLAIDNPVWAPYVLGGITSIAQPTFELGQKAAERLMAQIQGEKSQAAKILRLPGSLIERQSTLRRFPSSHDL